MRPVAVTARRMFGGHGLYADGRFFALIDDDTLYLKCDEATRARFDALELPPFVYAKDGKGMALSYRRAPDDALESPAAMRLWTRLAVEAALRAAAAKAKPGAAPTAKRGARWPVAAKRQNARRAGTAKPKAKAKRRS